MTTPRKHVRFIEPISYRFDGYIHDFLKTAVPEMVLVEFLPAPPEWLRECFEDFESELAEILNQYYSSWSAMQCKDLVNVAAFMSYDKRVKELIESARRVCLTILMEARSEHETQLKTEESDANPNPANPVATSGQHTPRTEKIGV